MYTQYDYDSIMHYDRWAYTRNGESTMIPKKTDATIGESRSLSLTDTQEIRQFYGCNK